MLGGNAGLVAELDIKQFSKQKLFDVGLLSVQSFKTLADKDPLAASLGTVSAAAVSIAGYRYYQKLIKSKIEMDGQTNFCKCKNRVKDRVVVITGGTSGIGREVVVDCAKNGAKIVVGCRDEEKGKDLKKKMKKSYGVDIKIIMVDFTSFESCKQFAENVKQSHPKIDFLVNNAGVFNVPYEPSEDNYEITWQINYLAHVIVTENLWEALIPDTIPGLQREDEKRNRNSVIFISSRAIQSATQEDLAKVDQTKMCEIPAEGEFKKKCMHYGLTKLGLWNYSQFLSLYAKRKELDIDVCSVDPGTCYTPIYNSTFKSISLKRFLHFLGTRSANEGAQSVIHCLNKRFKLTDRYNSGSLYRNCKICPFGEDKDEVLETLFVRKSLGLVSSFIPTIRTPATDPEPSLHNDYVSK